MTIPSFLNGSIQISYQSYSLVIKQPNHYRFLSAKDFLDNISVTDAVLFFISNITADVKNISKMLEAINASKTKYPWHKNRPHYFEEILKSTLPVCTSYINKSHFFIYCFKYISPFFIISFYSSSFVGVGCVTLMISSLPSTPCRAIAASFFLKLKQK